MAIRSVRPAANSMRSHVARPNASKMASTTGEAFDAIQDNLDQLVQSTTTIQSSLYWSLNGPYLYPTNTAQTVVVGYTGTDIAAASIVAAQSINVATANADASICGIFAVAGTRVGMASGISGAGSYLPLCFDTNATEQIRIDTAGNFIFRNGAQRIQGDFSNATDGSRVMFQTSTAGGNTIVGFLPNGAGNLAAVNCYSTNTATDASYGSMGVTAGGTVSLYSGITGAGTYLPIAFFTSALERARITTAGWMGLGTTNPTSSNGGVGVVLNIDSGFAGANKNSFFVASGNHASNSQTGGGIEVRTTATVTGDSRLGQFNWQRIADITGGHASSQFSLYVVNDGSLVNAIAIDHAGNVALNPGNLNFQSTSQRIQGDFSNATDGSRVLFQTTIANSNTIVGAVPIGSASLAAYNCYSTSSAANASYASFGVIGGYATTVYSGITGAGTYLPIAFLTSGAEQGRVSITGQFLWGLTSSDLGSGVIASLGAINAVTASSNASICGLFAVASTRVGIASGISGGGTYLDMAFDTHGSERMRITQDNKLLWGLTSSDIGGGVIASLGAINAVTASSNASICGLFAVSSARVGIASSFTGVGTTLPLCFDCAGAERMRILTNGRILINRTTEDGTGAQLQVSGSISVNGQVLTVP